MQKLLLGLFLVMTIGITPAFAQILIDPITVKTDKAVYLDGDMITVNGEVRHINTGMPVTMKIIAPNGNLVQLAQLEVNTFKNYQTDFTTGGALMKASGEYKVIVSYGDKSKMAETTFAYYSDVSSIPADVMETFTQWKSGTIIIDENNVNYNISNGDVLAMEPNVGSNSILIDVETTDNGSLILELPRSVIGSMDESGVDTRFVVIDNTDNGLAYQEIDTSELSRTINIDYNNGTSQIEVIGTYAIPEFGMVVAMILLIGLVTAIVASKRMPIAPQ
jgi:hypothetical protein